MHDVIESLAFRTPAADAADDLVRMSTGPIANKRAFIAESLRSRNVIAACLDERIAGYAVWDRAFFGRAFVWLLGVDRAYRRRGIALRLLGEFARRCPGEAAFTSTNESNLPMQAVLARAGFTYSGRVENLDPGDPELFYFRSAGACA